MSFSSIEYLAFLPLIFLLHYWCAARWRTWLLVVVSVGFYAALRAPSLLMALGCVTVFSWALGLQFRKANARKKRFLLSTGIAVNLFILAGFKYYSSLASWIWNGTGESPLLIIGLSYYVFQAISYLVDIQLETIEPEHDFSCFFLYISFFPKLLQGPIERAGDLLPQLRQPYVFDYDQVRSGLLLFGWGLFKKVVIADRLALFVNPVFSDISGFSGAYQLLGVYLFALQIYFDFSGYTDMAIGSARLFGIELTNNFNQPYLATSVADFWRRWHISFSRWILDYIFRPMQMLLRNWSNAGTAVALLVTFIISGLWHGNGLNFIVWGALHGFFLAASVYYRPIQKKVYKSLRVEKTKFLKVWQCFVTFHLVCFAWIFFRAESTADAFAIVSGIGKAINQFIVRFHLDLHGTEKFFIANNKLELFIVMLFLAVYIVVHMVSRKISIFKISKFARWVCYAGLLYVIAVTGIFSQENFIYFQF